MSDGYEIRGRIWPPAPGASRPLFLYLHGIQSHGGWFEWSASLLAQRGAAVLLPDRRGSGLNQAGRGDTPSGERLLRDCDELIDAVAANAQEVIPVGVSWGAKLAVLCALRRPRQVWRLILIAPGLFPKVDIGLRARIRVAVALARDPARRFAIPLSDPALFTENPEGRTFIRNDPLKLEEATARFLFHSTLLDRRVKRILPGALAATPAMLLADRDRIVRSDATSRWLKRTAASRATACTLPAAHTLEFEPDLRPFQQVLEAWRDSSGCTGWSRLPCAEGPGEGGKNSLPLQGGAGGG
jgi:acylglycerol lipase